MNFLPLPCPTWEIGYATSRSKRIEMGKGIDHTGVQPDADLGDIPKTEWVRFAKAYLESGKKIEKKTNANQTKTD